MEKKKSESLKRRILTRANLLTLIAVIVVASFVVGFGVNWDTDDPQEFITIGSADVVYASGTPDYTCDGVNDDVELQAALDALPAGGGMLNILGGNYSFSATVTRAIANVSIQGIGRSTYITYDGVNPIFTAGGNNWIVSNIRFDAGGATMGATTGWMWTNVTVAATNYSFRNPYIVSIGNNLSVDTFTIDGTVTFTPQTATGDGTTTIDWAEGNKFNFTFGAFNEVFTFTDPATTSNLLLKITQDGVGGRTATWPVSVLWSNGVVPVLSVGAGDIDIFTFYFDGTNYFGNYATNYS